MDRNNEKRRDSARARLAARQGKVPASSSRGENASDGQFRQKRSRHESPNVSRGDSGSFSRVRGDNRGAQNYRNDRGPSRTGNMRPVSQTGSMRPVRNDRDSFSRNAATANSKRGRDKRDKRARVEEWRSPSVESINAGRAPHAGGTSLVDRLGKPFIIVGIIVIILLVAVILLAFNTCSSASNTTAQEAQTSTQNDASNTAVASGSAATSESAAASESSAAVSSSNTSIDEAALKKVVDDDVASKLINRAASSEDALWIAQNPTAFSSAGTKGQAELLELAADEPAAQSYVRNFPDKYPMDTPENGSVKTVTTGKNIPRFYQWDTLWGYTKYAGTAFGLTGSGPTCMAMVYQGVMESTDVSPYDMANYAEKNGYSSDSEGTYVTFFTEGARSLNLSVTELDATEKALKNALQSGQVVVVGYAPGQITDYEHYVVISGMNQDGTVVMNDPYSEERSNKTWDISTIVNEGQVFYAYGG